MRVCILYVYYVCIRCLLYVFMTLVDDRIRAFWTPDYLDKAIAEYGHQVVWYSAFYCPQCEWPCAFRPDCTRNGSGAGSAIMFVPVNNQNDDGAVQSVPATATPTAIQNQIKLHMEKRHGKVWKKVPSLSVVTFHMHILLAFCLICGVHAMQSRCTVWPRDHGCGTECRVSATVQEVGTI